MNDQKKSWKENLAEEYNNAMQDGEERETASQVSYKTGASNASNASYIQRKDAARAEAAQRKEWDASTTASQRGLDDEDKIAAKIAAEVLKDNAKLRAVHSGQSIKMLLEREAKRQMQIQA